jgi:polysaccharide pyruvyl transferase
VRVAVPPLVDSIPRKLRDATRRARKVVAGLRDGVALAASRGLAVPYLGAIPLPNLGDVALLEAVGRLLNRVGVQLVPYFRYPRESFQLQFARRLGLKATHFCLGGGTLINSPVPLQGVRCMEALGLTGFSFGTGVRDPRFWNRVDTPIPYPRELPQWVESLARFDLLSVRGPLSASILRRCGLPRVKIVGDPALQFWRPPAESPERTNRIAMNLCSGYGRIRGNDERGLFERLRIVAGNLLRSGAELVFISVWPVDDDLVQGFASELDGGARVSVELVGPDVQRFLSLVASCDLMVSMRLHAAVLAMCRSVPVVSVEYQPKVYDFMDSMCLACYNVRPDELDAAQTTALIHEALERRLALRHVIRRGAQHYQRRQARFAAAIRNRLASTC